MELSMGNMGERLSSQEVSTKLARIASLARQMPEAKLSTLAHYIGYDFLREAYARVRKDGVPGVDQVTAQEYATELEENLKDLLNRFKSGRYFAPPVRRAYVPKADGGSRPLGIPTLEDKVLQKAVSMVLEAVYEQDFLPSSYGYRPKRSAHHALHDLREELMAIGGGWVLEVDVKSYFDTVSHSHLRSFLDKRVTDGVIRRMIDKWLKAGVLEEERVWYPEEGTPQGGVISPLLANIYLHEVLDVWFEQQVRPCMRGRVRLFRYADDFVICFQREDDARKVAEVLPKRFAKYGLTLHPDKTRLLCYRKPPRNSKGSGPPTFDFLGFTHYWMQSRRGTWTVQRRTIAKRLARKIKQIWQWCRANRHEPVKWQRKRLASRLEGYYNYHGVRCNYAVLEQLYREVCKGWRYWLSRRSQRANLTWERFNALLEVLPLPRPRITKAWV